MTLLKVNGSAKVIYDLVGLGTSGRPIQQEGHEKNESCLRPLSSTITYQRQLLRYKRSFLPHKAGFPTPSPGNADAEANALARRERFKNLHCTISKRKQIYEKINAVSICEKKVSLQAELYTMSSAGFGYVCNPGSSAMF